MDRLAEERSELFHQLLRLDQSKLSREPFLDSWTAKDLLAHLAAWDRWEHAQMERMVAGDPPEEVATDAFNTLVVAESRDQSLTEVVEEVRDARASWIAWLHDLPDDAFYQRRPHHGWDWAFPNCLRIQWEHDAEHAAQVAAWRRGCSSEHGTGPKSILLAALEAARRELLSAAARVPAEARASREVCGIWTLKDLLGHLADWEEVGVEGLRMMAQGRPPDVEEVTDIDGWNREHVAARRNQPWDQVSADLHETRSELAAVLKGMSEERIPRWYRFPWGARGTAYDWLVVFVTHDRDHARDLREIL
jgi:uncharacterized damage-inducible protein DinB